MRYALILVRQLTHNIGITIIECPLYIVIYLGDTTIVNKLNTAENSLTNLH